MRFLERFNNGDIGDADDDCDRGAGDDHDDDDDDDDLTGAGLDPATSMVP